MKKKNARISPRYVFINSIIILVTKLKNDLMKFCVRVED